MRDTACDDPVIIASLGVAELVASGFGGLDRIEFRRGLAHGFELLVGRLLRERRP